MGASLFLVFLAGLLVLLNGFFVAAEFSLVKLRSTRVQSLAKVHGWRGRLLRRVHSHLDAYLSACQLGITLASLALGWIGEPAFADLLQPLFAFLGIHNAGFVHAASFFSAFFLISFLHIVIGELAPKSLAIRQPERVGLWTAAPLFAFYWLMVPAIWVLNQSANAVLHWFGLDTQAGHDAHYSVDELKQILRTSRVDTQFSTDEWRVLAQALDFRDLDIADLMRPFHEAACLHLDENIDTTLERIVQLRYSRYPCLDANGEVIGILHLKDVFIALRKNQLDAGLKSLLRPVQIVAPQTSATEVFRRFRQGAPHFAIIAYPGQTPLGFVTLDNLLAALVGEIRDEFRQNQSEWTRLDDGSLIGKASLPLLTLERMLGIDIEAHDVESVGGLIMQHLRDLPEEGQRIEFAQFSAVVKKMQGPRIVLVRIYPQSPTGDSAGI